MTADFNHLELKVAHELFFHRRTKPSLAVETIASGGRGIIHQAYWVAYYSKSDSSPQEISNEEMTALNELSPDTTYKTQILICRYGEGLIKSLVNKSLLITPESGIFQQINWHPLAKLYYTNSRWHDTNLDGTEFDTSVALAKVLSSDNDKAPPLKYLPQSTGHAMRLPQPKPSEVTELLHRRRTCRTFAESHFLSLSQLSTILSDVFAFTKISKTSTGLTLASRTSPAGGSIQATQCYLLIHRVTDISPGLYYYCSINHTLHHIPSEFDKPDDRYEKTAQLLAGQEYFANADVHFIMTTRFDRLFWKYRTHTKALKVSHLDAGHLAQTLHLACASQHLTSYISAAVNDKLLEHHLNFDPTREGVVAMMGVGAT